MGFGHRSMESMVKEMFGGAYQGADVLVTGHTGFKGAWLTEWLIRLGARVTGYSLGKPDGTRLHSDLGHPSQIRHIDGDIQDLEKLDAIVRECRPDYVFHLAAQSLVRESYRAPLHTYAVNVTGSIHLLEALRGLDKPCAAVFVTTDKCYENREWLQGYREDDSLGGHDPYSSSKAAAEIAIASWGRSFFSDHPVRIVSARAGNVVGGGDFAADRIIPDAVRALSCSNPILVRNPSSVRPWQHVLEPLAGYLWLAACLMENDRARLPNQVHGPFNFGPTANSNKTVGELVGEILKFWPGSWNRAVELSIGSLHEAGQLRLAIDKSAAVLGWSPVWSFEETVRHTVRWYRDVHEGSTSPVAVTRAQIETYESAGFAAGQPWSAHRVSCP